MYLNIVQMAKMFKYFDQNGSCVCYISLSQRLDE